MYQRLNARPSLQVRRAPCGTSRLHADIHSSRASASDKGAPLSSCGFHVAGIGRGRGGYWVKSKKKSLYSRAWYSTPHYKKGQKCTLDLRDETLELLITTFLWWRRGGGVLLRVLPRIRARLRCTPLFVGFFLRTRVECKSQVKRCDTFGLPSRASAKGATLGAQPDCQQQPQNVLACDVSEKERDDSV